MGLFHQLPFAPAGAGGHPLGVGRVHPGDADDSIFRRAARRRLRYLPRGVRGEELGHRHHRNQHHQPRRRALDRLRPAGVGAFRLPVRPRPFDSRCRPHAGASNPAGCDRGHARGHPLDSAGHPRGRVRARRNAVAGVEAPHHSVFDARHSHRSDHRHGARDWRDRADHHHRRAHLHRFPASGAAHAGTAVRVVRVAVFPVHGDADPDVQLDLAAGGGVPPERGCVRLRPGADDPRDERPRHLAALPPEKGDQVVSQDRPKAEVRNLSFYYGDFNALKNISMPVHEKRVTALIGPSGCGKSTFLRSFNRMHDLYAGNRYEGEIRMFPDDVNVLSPSVDPIEVRMRISMVFQKPNPFPKSIYENVAYGLRVQGIRDKYIINQRVEEALREAALWNEVKDRLNESGTALSGGQQQRLCIARALAPKPEIILFDEPTSALDPIATASIEELIDEYKGTVTVLIVTHNMQQAARVSDFTAYMYLGELIEYGVTDEIFIKPKKKQTEDYITGRFG